MTEGNRHDQSEVDRFIMERIDTVPHLEALLLLWRHRSQGSSPEKLAKQLWVPPNIAEEILQDLAREGFLKALSDSGEYCYQSDPEIDRVIGSLQRAYQTELIRITRM